MNSVWIGDLESDETSELMKSGSQAIYARGHIFWVREQFLMARPFSPERLEFTGDGFVVAEGVVVQPTSWRAAFGVSEDGPIVFQGGSTPARTLTVVDREGAPISTIGEFGRYEQIRLSPDGRRLAATLSDQGDGVADIWIYDLDRNVGSRLTFQSGNDRSPVWSADGKRVAFESNRSGNADIYIRPADGSGDAEPLWASEEQDTPEDWSPDGK